MNKAFYRQADLLITLLPYIAMENDFALHGGTAINFFIRNMPRLSVDIDLTYLPVAPRETTLRAISEGLERIATLIKTRHPLLQIEHKAEMTGQITKLFIKDKNALVKIEPNIIIRGYLFGTEERGICKQAEELFKKHVTVKTLSFSDLYGSKICAALDRQHPRDFFDIMLLLNNEGIDEYLKKSFIVYLLSHSRPIAELLSPNMLDFKDVYENEFKGMTDINVSYDELIAVRKLLIENIHNKLTEQDRLFLVSFKNAAPDWDLLGSEGIENMPAVKWKLQNINKMDRKKHIEAVDKLKRILNI